MRSKRLAPLAGLLTALIVLTGAVSYFGASGTKGAPLVETPYTPQGPIEIADTVDGMSNSYSGSLPIPGCNVLATGITASGSDPVRITLILRVIAGDPTCADTSSAQQSFLVSFTSPVKTDVKLGSVILNGAPVDFTIINRKK